MNAPPPELPAAAAMGMAAGLGLLAGIGFLVPAAIYFRVPPGTGRTVLLIAGGLFAVMLVRQAGRRLLRLLERVAQPWRLPALALYGLVALALAATLLLQKNP